MTEAMITIDEINELVRRYAPVFVFHEDEQYFPSSVEYYLDQVEYVAVTQDDNGKRTESNYGVLASKSLPTGNESQYDYLQYPDSIKAPLFGGEHGDAFAKFAAGDLASAKCYVHVVFNVGTMGDDPQPQYNLVDIQYFLFYPFNGTATGNIPKLNIHKSLGGYGDHEGDWEHVTVRLYRQSKQYIFAGMFMSEHSSGTWLHSHEIEMTNGRPTVYVSHFGHACWPSVGAFPTPGAHGFLVNLTSAKKAANVWDSQDNLEIMAIDDFDPTEGFYDVGFSPPAWVGFKGRWGRVLTKDEKVAAAKRAGHNVAGILGDILDKIPDVVKQIDDGPTAPSAKGYWLTTEDEQMVAQGWNMYAPGSHRHTVDVLADIDNFFDNYELMHHIDQTAKIAFSDAGTPEDARTVVFYFLGEDAYDDDKENDPYNSLSDWRMVNYSCNKNHDKAYYEKLYVPLLRDLRHGTNTVKGIRGRPLVHARIEMTNRKGGDAQIFMWYPVRQEYQYPEW